MESKFKYSSSKSEIIKNSSIHEKDTGSSFVQVYLLNAEISYLKIHVEGNRKDFAARLSLLKKIHRRKSLVAYVKRNYSEAQYLSLLESTKK